jgi:hypothetical protein
MIKSGFDKGGGGGYKKRDQMISSIHHKVKIDNSSTIVLYLTILLMQCHSIPCTFSSNANMQII